MFIRKSKIQETINREREKERRRLESIHSKNIDEIERSHRKETSRLKQKHYNDLMKKNKELKVAREAFDTFRERAVDQSNIAGLLKNFTMLFNKNTAEIFQQACKISECTDKIDRFILSKEAEIEKKIGVE